MSRQTTVRASVIVGLALALVGAGTLLPSDNPPLATSASVASASFAGSSRADLEQSLQALREHLATQPQDAHGWALLATGYVEQARLDADPSLYAMATAAIDKSLSLNDETNVAALSAQASLAAARHEFRFALSSARSALSVNPLDQVALAIRTDALTELGQYQRASRSAKAMDQLRPGLSATTRLAYQAELRGQLGSAISSFDRAAENASGSDLAFALVHQGDLERTDGRLPEAGRLYQQALRARTADPGAIFGLARIAAARGDLDLATKRAGRAVSLVPLPEYVTYLGELFLAQSRKTDAQQQFAVAEATARLAADQGVRVDLELALFLADHGNPADALDYAKASWRARQTVHTADALAWALHANQRDTPALRYARLANRLGTGSAQFLHHLGTIEAALGMEGVAKTHLRRALAADAGYSPWHREMILRTLRSLRNGS